jgi:predicted nucleotidyltransferase
MVIAVLFCIAFTVLLQAEGGAVVFSITNHSPPKHEVGVSRTANIRATFSDAVNIGTLTNDNLVVHGNLGALAGGSFSYDPGTRTVTLNPTRAFHPGEVLRVSATTGIENEVGTPLARHGWQFTVGPIIARSVAGFIDMEADLTPVYGGSVAWGDYDQDGDLDIVLTGAGVVSKVYRNEGGGVFYDIAALLAQVWHSSVAWGDFNNDGYLDILLTGEDVSMDKWSRVYQFVGPSSFLDVVSGLTGVSHSSVAWGDYDNDGDLDILLTGQDSSSDPVSEVYRNDGGSPWTFTDIGAALTGVYDGSVAWGDYDNDGDLDILLTGKDDAYNAVSKVYRNEGGGSFLDVSAALIGVYYSSVAWGDYDNDGDLDILLTGSTGSTRVSRVYRNDGGAFSDIGAGLTGVDAGSVSWGDHDNDGDLDILLTGAAGSTTRVAKVYRNDGSGVFADIGAGLTGVSLSSAAWGDVDSDSDLDILLTGTDGSGSAVKMYSNNSKPKVVTVDPSSGVATVGITTYFTTTWSDSDGSGNLKQCYFHIGDSPTLAGNVTLLYNAVKNKLWLLNDAGTSWTGGYAPGSANVMINGQANVYCENTEVMPALKKLQVRWAIKFKTTIAGSQKLGLKAKDIHKARAKGAWKGTCSIKI